MVALFYFIYFCSRYTMIDSKAIFNIKTSSEFENLALQIFKFQFNNNRVYRSFCDLLYKHPSAPDLFCCCVLCIRVIFILPKFRELLIIWVLIWVLLFILNKKPSDNQRVTVNFVGVAGFEPATSCSQSRRDDRATLHPVKTDCKYSI